MAVKVISGIALLAVAGGAYGYMVYTDAQTSAKESVSEFVQKFEALNEGKIRVTYGKVAADILKDNVTISGIALKNDKGEAGFKIESLTVAADGYVKDQKFPTSASIDVRDLLVVHEGILNSINKQAVGDLSKKPFNGSFGYQFTESSDTLSLSGQMSVGGKNDITADVTLSNIKGIWNGVEGNFAANDGTISLNREENRSIKRMIDKVRVNELSGVYVNKGEVEEFYGRLMDSQNVTKEEVESQIPYVIERNFGLLADASEIATFLKQPEKIAISLKPESPALFGEIGYNLRSAMAGNNDGVPEGIGFSIKAN